MSAYYTQGDPGQQGGGDKPPGWDQNPVPDKKEGDEGQPEKHEEEEEKHDPK